MSADYYVLIGEKEEGPFSLPQLRLMLNNGELGRRALVARDGWKEWKELGGLLSEPGPGPGPEPKKEMNWFGGLLFAMIVGGVVFVFGYAMTKSDDTGRTVLAWIVAGIGLAVYFLPTLIAAAREHRNLVALLMLNFLLGWTIIGWVAALVWALYRESATVKNL